MYLEQEMGEKKDLTSTELEEMMSWGRYELFSEKHSDRLIDSLDKYMKDEKKTDEDEIDHLESEVDGMLAGHDDDEDEDDDDEDDAALYKELEDSDYGNLDDDDEDTNASNDSFLAVLDIAPWYACT